MTPTCSFIYMGSFLITGRPRKGPIKQIQRSEFPLAHEAYILEEQFQLRGAVSKKC